MDFMTFFKQIKSGSLNQLTLITGDESYLIDHLTKYISEHFLSETYLDFNLTSIDHLVEIDEILSIGMTLPFFDERRVIVFQNSGLLKNLKDDQEDKFIKLIGDMPNHLYLVFSEKDLDKRKRSYKALSKSADVVIVDRLNRQELVKWITKRFKTYQKDVDLHVVNYFIEMINYLDADNNKNLYDLDNTIRMMCGTQGKITEKTVNQYVDIPIEHNIFKLMDAISTRKMSEAITILNHFIENGEPEIKIFFMISQQFRNIFKIKLLLDGGHSSATAASKLDIHPFVAKKAGNFATQFSNKQLSEIIIILEEVDQSMKSSGIPPQLLIEKALFQIAAVGK
ncbi:MAG TPA: DNA polymerase III subunit delta [Clostridiales bacterium UBA8960]|jgi:DNA polymerase-3 subunit delta|nr:DNA polymerase III subunit delta [Clostridiales bacterium UBA8960]